ncbi:MAG: HlyD family efflux transporter periplasmic adaptor subunit [Bryobacteraceae bacterium]
MPEDSEPKLITAGESPADPTYEQLRAELERLRERQQRLEQEQKKRTERQQQPKEEKQENEEEPERPPLPQRASAYVHEHPLRILIGGIVLIVILIAGYFLWNYIHSYESTDDAQIDGHINMIGPRVAGTVIGVYIENNQHVVKGQTLVDLDPRDYQVAVERARATLAQAQSQVAAVNPNVPITTTTTRTGISTAQADVNAAQAAVSAAQQDYQATLAAIQEAQADNERAEKDLARYRMLVDKDEIPRQVYDQAIAAAKAASAAVISAQARSAAAAKGVSEREAQLAQARSRLTQANRNAPQEIAIRQADIRSQQASAQQAKAALDQALLDLSYCKILAPLDGVIGDKSVEVGQRVEPAQQLFALVPLNDIWVTANFKETQIRNMRPGQPVTIHVDAVGSDYNGYVESLPGASGARFSLLPPENATGNYVKVVQRLPVRIRFQQGQDPNHRLAPGMSAEPKVWLR